MQTNLKKWIRTLSAAVIGFSTVVAVTTGSPTFALAAEDLKLSVGLDGMSAEYWPIWVAKKKGYFAGVAVEEIVAGSSSRAAQLAATNSVNLGSSSSVDSLRAIDGGAPLKIVLSNMNAATMELVAAKDITSVQGLKGKRVIVGGAKDITAIWWLAQAQASGMDGNKDAEVMYGGSSGQRFAALKAGGVEAATLTSPVSFIAKREGYKSLGLMSPYTKEMPYILWVANTQWLASPESREALGRFIRGYNRAVDFINDAANKDEASQILADAAKVDIEDAKQTFDLVNKAQSFKPGSGVPTAGIDAAIKFLDEAGDLKKPLRPASFYLDLSVLDATH